MDAGTYATLTDLRTALGYLAADISDDAALQRTFQIGYATSPDCVTGQILIAGAPSLVGRYEIEYCGI